MKKKIISIIIVLTIIFAILGATFAYWSWASDNANKTNVTFTIAADFSCGINGEGNITGANLAPASCTNSTYAIQRAITTTITNSGSDPVSMDMWLKVNSIDSGLSGTSNFKWALTTDSTSCTNNEVSHGSFQGKTANSTITLFTGETNTATYYLYIWLDGAETSTTSQNQSFSLSLGGACTNEVATPADTENYVVSATEMNIGYPIPDGVNVRNTPEAAMEDWFDDWSYIYPFYLKHTLGSIIPWYTIGTDGTETWVETNQYLSLEKCNADKTEDYEIEGINYTFECSQFSSGYVVIGSNGVNSYTDNNYFLPTLSNCMNELQYYNEEGVTYTCQEQDLRIGTLENPVVLESYVGFVITEEMATTNTGLVAGTYTLKGGDDGASFLDNAKIIYDAFGGVGCSGDNNLPATYDATYNPNPSSNFSCYVSGHNAYVDYSDYVIASASDWYCYVGNNGASNCGAG